MDKAINDDGILEIRVMRATDVWPAFTNNIARHPIDLFDPSNAPEEAGQARFVACDFSMAPGVELNIADLDGAHWYNNKFATILRVCAKVGRYTLRIRKNGCVFGTGSVNETTVYLSGYSRLIR